MNTSKLAYRPVYKPVSYALLTLGIALNSQWANARDVENGDTLDIDSSTALDSYTLRTNGTLNVNGATTQQINMDASTLNINTGITEQITATSNSTLNINGATITGTGAPGIHLTSSTATISGSTITSNTIGIDAYEGTGTAGSIVSVTDSTVTGNTYGIRASALSTLSLTNSHIEATGATSAGIRLFSSDMVARGGTIIGGANGIQAISNGTTAPRHGHVTLDGTHVEGRTGSAILVNGFNQPTQIDIQILNGSTLTGGNGTIVDVRGGAVANVLIANSSLNGNVDITGNATGNFTLNQAALTGDFNIGANSTGNLTLNQSSMTGDINIATDGTGNITLDQASLTGDITADASSTSTLVLQNNSLLTGNVTNVNSVTLDQASLSGDITADAGSNSTLALRNGSLLTGNVTNVDSVTLDQASLTGNITADASSTGTLTLRNGSLLTGNVTNVDSVTLDQSSLTGDITVDAGTTSTLALRNGSLLTGNVTNVDSVTLDQASLTGDITADPGSPNTLVLQNSSLLTGNLINVDSVALNSQSQWMMAGDNTIGSLAMNQGRVTFGAPNEFYQLNTGTLSGNGTFVMDVDFSQNLHDVLSVTGTGTGSHTLLVAGSGTDPVDPQQLDLVHVAAGDANFALLNGPVDVGTYSYALYSRPDGAGGTDWYLDPTKPVGPSPGTRSVLALFNTAPTVWYGELTSLRTRMGELRFNGGQAGGWVRSYGNKYNVAQASGVGYQQNQQGISFGADAPLPFGDGQWLIGAMLGYSQSDLNLDRGTSGTVKSSYVGAYTTWLNPDSGYYFDGVLKFNRFQNDSQVSMSDGKRAKGDYDNLGMGGSAEFGRHIKLDNGYFIEPYTQLSAVVIQGKDYGLNNGMQAEGDRTRSLLGKVGMTAGRNFTLPGGTIVQPYVRLAMAHEFAKNNEVQVNNNTFNNDLSGSRGELGTGLAVALTDRLQVHADFEYSKGEYIEQPFGVNVGARYSW
jgi:outer membrane autotransporter protein